MTHDSLQSEISQLQQEIIDKRKRLAELRKQLPKRPVKNYEFLSSSGKSVSLLDLFGDKKELLVVHNTGKSSPYCTMYADGFNGIYHHIIERCAFVLSTPDAPEIQDAFASERQWKFPIVSTIGTTFKEDVGFTNEHGFIPGISVFEKGEQGTIYHVADIEFGPWDDYCILWSLLDLLPFSENEFSPTLKINKTSSYDLTNNIAIVVQDLENAVSFYKDTIGMTLEDISEKEARLSFGGKRFYLEEAEKSADVENVFFEFSTKDFSDRLSELSKLGCTIVHEFSPTSVLLKDPFGMKFHLFESVRDE